MVAWRYSQERRDRVYVGNIAEIMVLNVLKGARCMRWGNPGYDYIHENQKIDVKSSLTRSNGWTFLIKRNKIADKFLCLGLEDIGFLKPVRMWMIPGKLVKHEPSIRITKKDSELPKWRKFEMPLDELLTHKKSHKIYVGYIKP